MKRPCQSQTKAWQTGRRRCRHLAKTVGCCATDRRLSQHDPALRTGSVPLRYHLHTGSSTERGQKEDTERPAQSNQRFMARGGYTTLATTTALVATSASLPRPGALATEEHRHSA